MSVSRWIETRTPPAPAELQGHMAMLLAGGTHNAGESDAHGSDSLADPLLAACNVALARVLDSGAASRDSALDLLSADAFVTYAFEAAADAPESISERSNAAMRQISDLALARLTREVV